MFLLVLLPACLHKVGIRGHFASWLPWILNHLVLLNREKIGLISKKCIKVNNKKYSYSHNGNK